MVWENTLVPMHVPILKNAPAFLHLGMTNIRQLAPFRPSPLLARQKRGVAGRANLRGWTQTHAPPRLKED